MKIHILLFGQLSEITGTETLTVNDLHDTDELIDHLINEFPALKEIPFAYAVDKTMVRENTPLYNNCSVALLPPFSGG